MTIKTVALSKLVFSKENVRRSNSDAGIEQLAADIASKGLLQNLNVKPAPKGKYEVVAGGRRLKALKLILKEGGSIRGEKVTKDYQIAVSEAVTDDVSATEISLSENFQRSAMHPADEIEAFAKLNRDEGLSPEEIAARFGISHMTVRRRIALANLSPRILEAFRNGTVTLEQCQAVTLTNDHAQQEAVLLEGPGWRQTPYQIKAYLSNEKMDVSDGRVEAVGLEAYTAAGGIIERDLFADEDEGYIASPQIVIDLLTTKVEAQASLLRADGWKWVEVFADTPPDVFSMKREYPTYAEIDDEAEEGDEDAEDDGNFTPEQMARSGVYLWIDYDGINVARGLIKPEDVKAVEVQRVAAETGEPVQDNETTGEFSKAVVEELSAHKTLGLQIELVKRPEIALAVAVHSLACNIFLPGYNQDASAAEVRGVKGSPENFLTENASSALDAMKFERERWEYLVPGNPKALLAWCLAQESGLLLEFLAYLTALTVSGVRRRDLGARQPRCDAAETLAEVLSLDMREHWTPSEAFFNRVPNHLRAQAVRESGIERAEEIARRILKAKKADAVTMTVKALEGTGWLPPALMTEIVKGELAAAA